MLYIFKKKKWSHDTFLNNHKLQIQVFDNRVFGGSRM